MKIGIIGAGNVGTGLAGILVRRNHEIFFSFARDRDKLAATARSFGAQAGTVPDAIAFGEIVILATPWNATARALQQAGPVAERKILWDCTNALKPDLSGLEIGTTTSAGEEVARLAPWARVVKAIPPFAELLHSSSLRVAGQQPAIFVCGDDAAAKSVVQGLLVELDTAPIDAGPLRNARYTEPAGFLMVQLAYALGYGTTLGLSLLRPQ
jgi:predicted dinucleotide-binding enzyme